MHKLDTDIALAAKVDEFTRKLDILVSNGQDVSTNSRTVLFCETC